MMMMVVVVVNVYAFFALKIVNNQHPFFVQYSLQIQDGIESWSPEPFNS